MYFCRPIKHFPLALTGFLVTTVACGQANPDALKDILSGVNLSPAVSAFQVRQYILSRIPPPPDPPSREAWTEEAKRIRQHTLHDIVFHGWPADWIDSPPNFEQVAVIDTGDGYKLRKLRYEIVPGFFSVAILYEPDHLQGKVPAILNVNGHEPVLGKAADYKQKRCINYAKRGIMALNLEWLWCGELHQPGNSHWNGAHLDLVGSNELGLFYLEMRRGLDYLYNNPNVDRTRLGVTGLSGGGWQTIILSSLDERVGMAMPVAGFSSNRTRVEVREYGDLGDVEQSATDLLEGQDYTDFVAMMAPRPLQLAYNAEDDCCYRAALVKPLVYDAILPVYNLYGKEDAFAWHENRDPGTHNYQQDNRETSYRFFDKVFGLPASDREIPVGRELKSYDQLVVGLPKDNLTILGLARKLASEIQRPPVPTAPAERAAWAQAERKDLAKVVRYKPVTVNAAQPVAMTKHLGVETTAFLFPMSNGLTINGVWLRAIGIDDHAPVTVILNDDGKKAAGREVADRVNRGEQVLVLDLLFTGDAWGKDPSPSDYTEILHGIGERPIGMEAAQLIAASRWALQRTGDKTVRLETTGMRSQVAGLIAAALEPDLFSKIVVHEGISSLGYLLEKPVAFQDAPELFCLDLYKKFDIDRLAMIAAPTEVKTEKVLELAPPSPEHQATSFEGGAMKMFTRGIVFSWLVLLAAGLVFSQQPPALAAAPAAWQEPQTFPLWENGAPGALGHEESDIPTLTYYPALGGVPTAVIVAPGGGYRDLAMNHEGRQVANWLNAAGITAFVLKYRLGPRYHHPIELGDAQRAIRLVRAHAAQYRVKPDRIGMMGFSAGGHLTSTAETHFDAGNPHAADPIDRMSSRPDFAVLCYPVISFVAPYSHRGSAEALLGDSPDPKLLADLSNELHVTPETPPTFLFSTSEDTLVPSENSVAFYLALHKAHVPAELHIFQRGQHGVGLDLGDPALGAWPTLVINWLRGLGLLQK